jgi:hypothetical protein
VSSPLPPPSLTFAFRLEVTLGEPHDLGETPAGRRRIVPWRSGAFAGPDLTGAVVPAGSADWQIVRPDGTAFGDTRCTLETDRGDLIGVRIDGIRHGSATVLARLAAGEDVDPSAYTFRISARLETGAERLDWLNKGVFVGVGARQPAGVVYDLYLVG